MKIMDLFLRPIVLIIRTLCLEFYLMLLSDEALSKFKQLYLKEYGVDLDDERALEMATRLVTMVKAIYGTDPEMLEQVLLTVKNRVLPLE